MEQNNTIENTSAEETRKNRTAFVIFAVVFVAVTILGGWFWKKQQQVIVVPAKTPAPLPENTTAGLGTQISERVENPTAGKVPETNPFKTETNPLKGAYQNPFN